MKQGSVSRVLVERFNSGDDILAGLNDLVRRHNIRSGSFTAIGAVEKATVGFFMGNGRYSSTSLNGPLEVVACVGNVSIKDDIPFIHAHVTLADREGRAFGGHLMSGCTVGATFEVTMYAHDGIELSRRLDPQTKLSMLDA